MVDFEGTACKHAVGRSDFGGTICESVPRTSDFYPTCPMAGIQRPQAGRETRGLVRAMIYQVALARIFCTRAPSQSAPRRGSSPRIARRIVRGSGAERSRRPALYGYGETSDDVFDQLQ